MFVSLHSVYPVDYKGLWYIPGFRSVLSTRCLSAKVDKYLGSKHFKHLDAAQLHLLKEGLLYWLVNNSNLRDVVEGDKRFDEPLERQFLSGTLYAKSLERNSIPYRDAKTKFSLLHLDVYSYKTGKGFVYPLCSEATKELLADTSVLRGLYDNSYDLLGSIRKMTLDTKEKN